MKLTRRVSILFLVTLFVIFTSACNRKAAVTQAVQGGAVTQEVGLRGEPGCHYGGCKDGPEKCKMCNEKGDCWCSDCCVALSERPAGWEAREEEAKKKAMELVKQNETTR